MSGNIILITGGATGIGLSLAARFLRDGNEVIVTGRRKERLHQAEQAHFGLNTYSCDLTRADERESLVVWVLEKWPRLNILVNNAGIQRQIDFTHGTDGLRGGEDEVAINFSVPVDLSARLIPHLLTQPEAAIVNVSSGLGFVPIASMPVYCATKAALHSFNLSLRHQLRNTSVRVVEIIPPTVDTELDQGRRQGYRGIPASQVAEEAIDRMAKGEMEIAIGQAEDLRSATPDQAEQVFQRMNGNR